MKCNDASRHDRIRSGPVTSRRILVLGSGLVVARSLNWHKPLIDSLILPAHAQGSVVSPPTEPPPEPPASCVAGPVRQTRFVPRQTANWIKSLEFDQYNDAKLTSVAIAWDVAVSGTIGLENMEAATGDPAIDQTRIGASVSAEVAINYASGGQIALLEPRATAENTVDAHDGSIDFGGASGRRFDSVTANESGVLMITDPAELARFQGTGAFILNLSWNATSNAFGTANLVANIQTFSEAAVQLTYRCV